MNKRPAAPDQLTAGFPSTQVSEPLARVWVRVTRICGGARRGVRVTRICGGRPPADPPCGAGKHPVFSAAVRVPAHAEVSGYRRRLDGRRGVKTGKGNDEAWSLFLRFLCSSLRPRCHSRICG